MVDFGCGPVRNHTRLRTFAGSERPEEEPKQTKCINLPYIQGLSEQLKRTLNKQNIKATFYTQTTLRSLLSKPKDHIPREDGNNAVYQLNCKDCEARWDGRIKINPEKTKVIIFSKSRSAVRAEPALSLYHDLLSYYPQIKFLGITFDNRMTFTKHFEEILERCNKQ